MRSVGVTRINEFFTRNLLSFSTVVDTRQLEESCEGLQLFGGTLQNVKGIMEGLLIGEVCTKSDIGLSARTIAVFVLYATRQGGNHYVTQRTHVILAYPFPQPVLVWKKHGLSIKHTYYILHLDVTCGGSVVHTNNKCRMSLCNAKRHLHPYERTHLPHQRRWNGIGEKPVKGQREDDVTKKPPSDSPLQGERTILMW